MKRLVSLLLAVIMTLSMTLGVSAAPVQQQESVANEISLEDDIDGYSDLSGRYNYASGITEDFDIPSNVEKVKVGWKNAYVTTVKDGKLSMAAASQTVTL